MALPGWPQLVAVQNGVGYAQPRPRLGPLDRLLSLVAGAAPHTAASSVLSLAKGQTPWPPPADSCPQHEPHAAHARIFRPETSLRCSMNHAIKATAHENNIRRWQTFTSPQSPAHAAHCGLVLHWRAYVLRIVTPVVSLLIFTFSWVLTLFSRSPNCDRRRLRLATHGPAGLALKLHQGRYR